MTAKKSFTTYFIFSLFLAYLSQPSVVSAWSHPDSAPLIVFDKTESASISDIGEKQYRKFDLTAPGNVSVVFTHDQPGYQELPSDPAWEIKLQDKELFDLDKAYMFKTSALNDNGVTCSQWLGQPGTYYLLVKGVDNSVLPLGPDKDYFVTVTQKTNVKLRQGGKETYHPMIGAAYGAATAACTIRSACARLDADVTIDKDFSVTIDGGQDCCLENNEQGYTMIGSLIVKLGRVIVKGLKVY